MSDENRYKVVRGLMPMADLNWKGEIEYLAIVDTQRNDEIFRIKYAFKQMPSSKVHEEKLKIICFILNTL